MDSRGVLDVEEALQRFSGNRQIFLRLLDRFLELNSRIGEKAQQVVVEGDLGNMAIFFHSIKGGAGNLSARDLCLKAAALEQLSLEGDADSVRRELPAFLDLFVRLRGAADGVRKSII
jgi:HPt (histidine-containing phosphotransfer) domain-containing protein